MSSQKITYWNPVAMVLVVFGLGSYLGWQIIDISPTLFAAPLTEAAGILAVTEHFAKLLMVLLLIVTIRSILLGHFLIRHRSLLIAILACMTLGTATMYLFGWFSALSWMPGVVIGRLMCCASAVLMGVWGEVLSRVRPVVLMPCISFSYALAFGISLLVVFLDPIAAMLFKALLPLFSGIAILFLRAQVLSEISEGSVSPCTRVSFAQLGLPIRLFVGIGLFGAILTVTNHVSELKTDVSSEMYTLVTGITISLIMGLGSCSVKQCRRNLVSMYRLIAPLIVGCLLLILVLQPYYQFYEAIAIGGSWTLFRIVTWVLWGRVGGADIRKSACTFACGQMFLTLLPGIADLICKAINYSDLTPVVLAAVIIMAAVLTSVFVIDANVVARSIAPDEKEKEIFIPAEITDSGLVLIDDVQDISKEISLEEFSQLEKIAVLSEREIEVCWHIVQGEDNEDICHTLCVADSTLKTHLRNIYKKLSVHSREELLHYLEHGLAENSVFEQHREPDID